MTVRSSNFTRTIDSAKAQLHGILNTTEDLIPIKVKSHDVDYLLKPDACPGIWLDLLFLKNSSDHSYIASNIQAVEIEIANILGNTNYTYSDLMFLSDSITHP